MPIEVEVKVISLCHNTYGVRVTARKICKIPASDLLVTSTTIGNALEVIGVVRAHIVIIGIAGLHIAAYDDATTATALNTKLYLVREVTEIGVLRRAEVNIGSSLTGLVSAVGETACSGVPVLNSPIAAALSAERIVQYQMVAKGEGGGNGRRCRWMRGV